MSMVLWITEEGLEGDESTSDLWALYEFSSKLDRICVDGRVTKISAFHDNSVMAAEFDQEIPVKFSDATSLLSTLEVLRTAVDSGSHRFIAHGEDRSSDLSHDLDEAIRVSLDCKNRGKRVRLSIIP